MKNKTNKKENPFTDAQPGFKRAFDEFGWDARGTSLMPVYELTSSDIKAIFKKWHEEYIENPEDNAEMDSYKSSDEYAADCTKTFLDINERL